MTSTTHLATRSANLLRALAISTVLLLGTAACSGNDPGAKSDTATSATAPDAKQATQDLEAGLKAHAAGDLEEAAAKYTTVLEHDETNKFALYNLALIDEAEGNYGLAEEKYRSALKSDAAYAPALFNLAILRTDNDPKEAISLYEQVIAADESDAGAWLNLGLLMRASGQEREGDKYVLRAIALNPDLVDPAATSTTAGQ